MIGRLSGKLLQKEPPALLVDVNGVGYELEAPMTTFYDLPATGARRLVTTCPSCYHPWAHEYPRILGESLGFEVLHATELLADDPETCYCERSAFETLLRLQRALARPDFEALPAAKLAPFLMEWTASPAPTGDRPAGLDMQIAEALGFAAPSAFSRWLRQQRLGATGRRSVV